MEDEDHRLSSHKRPKQIPVEENSNKKIVIFKTPMKKNLWVLQLIQYSQQPPPQKKKPMKHVSKVAGVGGERMVMVFDGGSHHTERQISRVVI